MNGGYDPRYAPGPAYGRPPGYGPPPGYGQPPYAPPGYGQPPYAPPGYGPPPGFGPPPPPPPVPRKRRLGPWFALGGVALVTVIVAAVAIVALVVSRADDDQLMAGDDSVHPAEVSSLKPPESQSRMVAPLASQPALRPLPGDPASPVSVADSDDSMSVVIAGRGSTLIGIDAATTAVRFRAGAPAGVSFQGCVIAGDRIGCVAYANGNAGTVYGLAIVDKRTGATLTNVALPEMTGVPPMYGTADRIIVKTGFEFTDTMLGFDLSGRQVWTAPASYVFPDAGIVVRDDSKSSTVTFLNAESGSPIADVNWDGYFNTAWEVYRDGVAVLNADRDGTDFYRVDGTKSASLKGWHPVLVQGDYDDAVPPVPLVGRMANAAVYDSTTIGAANPATGHLLWKQTRSEFSGNSQAGMVVGSQIVAFVGKEGGPTGPMLRDDRTEDVVSVLDPMTGRITSARIHVPRLLTDAALIASDGQRLIVLQAPAVTAFDLTSGQQVWKVNNPPNNPRAAVAGRRIIMWPSEESPVVLGN